MTGFLSIAFMALGVARSGHEACTHGPGHTEHSGWFLSKALADVDLSPGQLVEIDRIRQSNQAWLEALRHDYESARTASLSTIGPDFDRPNTGPRFQRQGEIAAMLWGNQARIATEVAALLEPQQRRVLLAYVGASSDVAPTWGTQHTNLPR